MALLGQGVLAIWNGIDPEAESDFVAWHVGEHIPERVGLPGFLRGRRYVAVDGYPKFFNFYETERPETLESATYVTRLNDPTPWTRRVVAHFHDTSRTVCDVVVTLGRGEGAWLEAIQIQTPDGGAFRSSCETRILPELIAVPGVCGAHLLHGRRPAGSTNTAETKLRGGPDASADWILLVEAVEQSVAANLREGILSRANLGAGDVGVGIVRGLYRLQFSLSHAELDLCIRAS
jgi:hypothetical protein